MPYGAAQKNDPIRADGRARKMSAFEISFASVLFYQDYKQEGVLMVDIVVAISSAMGIAKQLKDTVELVQSADAKMKLASLLESLADAKIAVADLKSENADLKENLLKLQKNAEDEVILKGSFYWKKDDTGPYCVRCHDKDDRLSRVLPTEGTTLTCFGASFCVSCQTAYPESVSPK